MYRESEPTLLCLTLQRLMDDKEIDAQQIASMLDVGTSSVYRRLNDQTQITAKELRRIFVSSLNPKVQRALLAYLIDGTSWSCVQLTESLDVDGDGDVDTSDALRAAIMAVAGVSDALNLLGNHIDDGIVTHEESAELSDLVGQVMQKLVAVEKIAKQEAGRRGRRRQAHVRIGG